MISAVGLRWVWWFLPLFLSLHSSSGYFSLKVQSPVSGLLGSSVSLHCSLTDQTDVRQMEVRWYRPKMSNTPVLLYKDTQIMKSPVDVQYQDRVSLLGELEKGNVSLKLENLRLADRGEYVCHVTSKNWYDKATVSLSVRVVGSVPVVSSHVAEGGKVNVSCQSHGWLPEPSVNWTDNTGKDLKHLSNDKFTNNSEGLVDVSSWLIVSPSESEWISCSVGLSGEEIKDSRIMLVVPPESWKVSFTVTLILLLLCVSGSAVCLVRYRNVLMNFRRTRTSGRPSERKLLDENCVTNQDKSEGPAADTDHHTVDGGSTPQKSSLIESNNTPAAVPKPKPLDQVKKFKENITIDPDETPAFLSFKRNKLWCSVPKNCDSNTKEKIFTLCRERFKHGEHYWEVKVRESHSKVSWFIGVASEEAERKFNIPFTPQNGLWVLCYKTESGFYIEDQTLPGASNELTAVGVFLDCDKHTLSFYNKDTQSHIYTFTDVESKSSLCPLISPGVEDIYPIWIL